MATKKPGKDLVKWDEEFAGLAKAATKGIELPSAKFLSIRGGKLSFAGHDVPDNELRAIIVGWVHENQYYEGAYDPGVAQVPSCYAFGTDQEEMAPHEKASEPQSESCATCPLNQWDSGHNGRGKACKNVLRLALISETDLEDLEAAEIVYMKIPVMSVKNFLVFAKKQVADALKRPYWAVVTSITVRPDAQSQYKVEFKVAEKVEDSKLFTPLKALWESSMEGIDFPYPAPVERKPAPAKSKAKPTKFGRR